MQKEEKEEEAKIPPKKAVGKHAPKSKREDFFGGTERAADQLAELEHIKPKAYDPYEHWPLDGSIMVVGKRRAGKTVTLASVMSVVGDNYLDGVYVFTKTKHNKFWSQYVPDERIYPGMDWGVVDQILDDQRRKRALREKTGKLDGLPYICIILDDMISSENDMRYTQQMKSLFFEGRHYDLCIVICSQDIKGVPPSIRQNVDQVFLTVQTQERQVKQIESDYADFGWGKKEAVQFLDFILEHTQDHHILVIDQADPASKITEKFYVYEPNPEPEPYKLGGKAFWKEAGCSWKKQQKTYDNVKKTAIKTPRANDPQVIALRAKQLQKDAKKNRSSGSTDNDESSGNGKADVDLKTAAIGMASLKIQDEYYNNLRKKAYENSAEKAVLEDMKFMDNLYEPDNNKP